MHGGLGKYVDAVFARQDGVATVRQLVAAGMTVHAVDAQVRARRWSRYGGHCVLSHNFRPTRRQWQWIALLDNVGPVALAGMTALEMGGFTFFGPETELIHVVVRRGAQYHRFPGVKVHESRRFEEADIVLTDGPPHLGFARSALDAGAWQPNPRYACGILAAVVQQRVVTPAQLEDALGRVGRIRHKQPMRLAVYDIVGGAEALSEIDVVALCLRHGLATPDRQRPRYDRQGRKRFLDCEWELPDGSFVVLEIDGSHHLDVEHWEADIRRQRQLGSRRRIVVRCTANEARYDQAALAADLRAHGVPSCQSSIRL